jgi:hypothetical protein
MTSTQIARLATIDAELATARKAGDIPRMQRLLGQRQRLMESVYGKPLA